VECNKSAYSIRIANWRECYKICPIDCLKEDYYFTNMASFHKDNNQKVQYYFWNSKEIVISYSETADMLLIDYFTYIGGLFGLWLGICLESLLDLIVKHTRNLRTKVKLDVESILSFIHIFSLCFLHCFNDLNTNFKNYIIEKVLSIQNRISQFKTWLRYWLELLIDIILTHARILRIKFKLYAKTLFSLTLTLIQLFIVLFLSLIFCSKSMFCTQVMKLLLFIHSFFYFTLKCIHDLIVMFINCVENKMFYTRNRVESIHL
jgi:hypothetical protein